jgi:hypothetical protein
MRKHVVPAAIAAFLSTSGLAVAQQPAPAAPASVTNGSFSLTTGVDVSTGKYGGASSTDILYVPLTGKYTWDKWLFQLTLPYIVVTGPGNVVRDIGIIKGKAAGPRRTESGLGDLVAGVTRNILDLPSNTLVDLTGKIKFGTADAGKGLGTGENDYGVQVDVTQGITPRVAVFGSLGYKFVGSPAGADLQDVLYGEVGGTFKVSDALRAGVILDASQAPSPVSGDQREVTAYLTQRLGTQWKLQVYGDHGFANGSPDWGGGAMVTLTF